MARQYLYIGFNGRQVVLESDAPEALAGLEQLFYRMLETYVTRPVGHLEVRRIEDNYDVLEDDGSCLQGVPLVHALGHIRYEVIQRLIRISPNFLWLHAGASVCGDRAVVIVGRSGCGKSTLVTNLCARGWTYLSDEVVPLELSSGKALPFPLTPAVRKDLGRILSLKGLRALHKMPMNLELEAICQEPVPAGALVFPMYRRHSSTTISPYPAASAALELLQSCQNFANHGGEAVRHICKLVESLPTYRVYFNHGPSAAALIAKALQT